MDNYSNNNIDYTRIQSQTISWLRLPLMILVVFIHVNQFNLIEINHKPYTYIIYFYISQILARSAVPLFFFFSAYLMFNTEKYKGMNTAKIYLTKLKSRFFSLFIPYIIWNVIFILFFKEDTNPLHYLNKLFNPFTIPPAFQFWFIKDLIFLILLSPVIYLLLKYCKIYIVWFLLLVYLFLWNQWCWNSYTGWKIALFSFCLGAYYGFNNRNFVKDILSLKFNPVITYLIISLICLQLFSPPVYKYHEAIEEPLNKLCAVIGAATLIFITAKLLINKKISPNEFLANSSFIVFALHPEILYRLSSFLTSHLLDNSFGFLAVYFISVIAVCIALIGFYKILTLIIPKTTAFITGRKYNKVKKPQ